MTFKKLLAAVSMVAISAGSASALTLTSTGNTITPALEVVLPGDPAFAGTTTISLTTDTGFYPAGNNIAATVTLPEGVVFREQVDGSDVGADGPALGTPNVSAIVQGGTGAAGTGTVTLLISIPQNVDIDELTFDLNYELEACVEEDAEFTMTAATEAGTDIEEGEASSASIIAECASALDGEVLSDADSSDTIITLNSDYDDIAPDGILGTVQYTIDTAVSVNGNEQPMTTGDVDEVTFDVVLENADGISSITVGGVNCPLTGLVASCALTGAQAIGSPQNVVVAVNAGLTGADREQIQTQSIAVENALVTFDPDADEEFITSEPGAEGDLDALQREGQAFGSFDWNGDSPTGTLTVYRVTGLMEDTPYTVTMSNSGADGTYNGVAVPNAFGEEVITSRGFGANVPTYGRGDAVFIFETNDDLDVDRLQIRNNVISAFGDGANADTDGFLGADPRDDSDN